MPRGPRVSEGVVVWAKAADVLRGHPVLKPELTSGDCSRVCYEVENEVGCLEGR